MLPLGTGPLHLPSPLLSLTRSFGSACFPFGPTFRRCKIHFMSPVAGLHSFRRRTLRRRFTILAHGSTSRHPEPLASTETNRCTERRGYCCKAGRLHLGLAGRLMGKRQLSIGQAHAAESRPTPSRGCIPAERMTLVRNPLALQTGNTQNPPSKRGR